MEDLLGKRGVQLMTATVRHEVPDDGVPHQRKVANRVEDLVADELVLEP